MTSTLADAPSTPVPAPVGPQGVAPQGVTPRPADPSMPRHFDFVDALRGLAIVGVVLVHVMFWTPNFHGRARTVAAQGQFGVELFFVVSAFTLFWSLRSRRSRERRPLLAFFTRRFFRLAPLFWVGIAFYVCVPVGNRAGSAPDGVRWRQVLATLAFVHGWYPTTVNSVVPGGWSIAAEAMFYLCIPVLFARVRTLNAALWLTLVAAWVTAGLAGPVEHRLDRHFPAAWGPLLHDFVYWSFPSQLPVFCLGIVLYFLLVDPSPAAGPPRVGGLFLVTAAAFAVFGAMGKQILPSVAFVSLAVGLARRPVAVLVNPATRFLGMVSFSGYIWHFWVLDQVGPPMLRALGAAPVHLGSPAQCGLLLLATGAATLPVATLSYYLIEVPGQSLGKWVIARMGWGTTRLPGVAVSAATPAGSLPATSRTPAAR